MKTTTINPLKALLGAMLLSGAIVTPVSAEPQGVVLAITGSGLTVVEENFFFPGSPGFSARQTISARQKSDGRVEGSFIIQIWFASNPSPIVLVQDITCLTLDGNTAYFGAVIRWSSDLSYAKPGDSAVGFVTDTDGNGPDISWSGPSVFFLAPGQDCTARPPMPQLPLASGNFIVR